MTKHTVVIAHIMDGNVQLVTRHAVTTALGARRLLGRGSQLWMTRDTALALGGRVETFWGYWPDGCEFMVKNARVIEEA